MKDINLWQDDVDNFIKEYDFDSYFHCGSQPLVEIAKNPSTLEDTLIKLSNCKYPEVLRELCKRDFTKFIRLSQVLFKKENYLWLSLNETLPINYLKVISESKSVRILSNLARNKSLPTDIIQKLVKYNAISINIGLALNPSIPLNLQIELAKEKDTWAIPYALTKNCHRSHVVDFAIIENKEIPVLCSLAQSTIDPDILRRLANRDCYKIRLSVAQNSRCPEDLLEQLSYDESFEVASVAISKLRSPKVLDKIFNELPKFEDFNPGLSY